MKKTKVSPKACMKYIRRSSLTRPDPQAEQQALEFLLRYHRNSGQTEKDAQELAEKGLAHAKEGGWLERKISIPQRADRFEKKLRKFFLWRCGGNEKEAKKAFSIFKHRGVGEYELFTVCEEMKDWQRTERRPGAKENWHDKPLEEDIANYIMNCKANA
jgi:hypothetical protein